jgi:hypothetical protein
MDSNYRLKIRIGQHEFEAEGPTDAVQQQFQAFKELIANLPSLNPSAEQAESTQRQEITKPERKAQPLDGIFIVNNLPKIMQMDGRVISLTVPPDEVSDAVLLILYGQKELRQNDSVSGFEILEGIKNTGRFSVTRVDRILEGLATAGVVIVIGEHRAKRYRLTNAGFARAIEVADSLIAKVP